MSDYNKITDYSAKDALLSGDSVKRVKGSEIGADFDAVAVAVATKANSASPVFTGISSFAVGAVGAPSIYMTGYATTGWYNIGANNWGFAVSGAKVLDIASTGLAVAGTLSASGTTTLARVNQSNGSIDFSSLGNGSTSWQIGTGTALKPLDIFIGGSVRAQFSDTGLAVTGTLSATGVSNFAAGTVGAPSIYLSTDTTTGWYRIGANNVGFAVSGAKVLDIASTGLTVTGKMISTSNASVGSATSGVSYIKGSSAAVSTAAAGTLSYVMDENYTALVLISDETSARTALYLCGTDNVCTEISDPSNGFSPTNTGVVRVTKSGATITLTNDYGVSVSLAMTIISAY